MIKLWVIDYYINLILIFHSSLNLAQANNATYLKLKFIKCLKKTNREVKIKKGTNVRPK